MSVGEADSPYTHMHTQHTHTKQPLYIARKIILWHKTSFNNKSGFYLSIDTHTYTLMKNNFDKLKNINEV